jgi:hypothetical protein
MVLIIIDKSIHGNTVHCIELSLHYLKESVFSQCLKDEIKMDPDELAYEENYNVSLPEKDTPRLINVLIQIY